MANIKKTERISSVSSLLKVNWALLCQNASVDQRSNLVSLQTVIEEITLSKTPELSAAIVAGKRVEIKSDFSLIAQLDRCNPGDLQAYSPFMEIRIVDPAGVELGKHTIPLDVQRDKRRLRVIISFNSFLVTKAGEYEFIISIKSANEPIFSEKTRVPLEIKIA
jgi:hypothetical protein